MEFYNRGDFAGFKFPNTLNFTMAVQCSAIAHTRAHDTRHTRTRSHTYTLLLQAITGGTAVFGSKRNPAQPVSLSSLFFRPCDKLMHDPYNPLPHWVVNMPSGEDITVPNAACACACAWHVSCVVCRVMVELTHSFRR